MSHATYYPDGGEALSPTPEPKRAIAINPAAAVADIADPTTASAEDNSNKINALLASLRASGLLAS